MNIENQDIEELDRRLDVLDERYSNLNTQIHEFKNRLIQLEERIVSQRDSNLRFREFLTQELTDGFNSGFQRTVEQFEIKFNDLHRTRNHHAILLSEEYYQNDSLKGDICSICLCDFVYGENISRLECAHVFHYDCIRDAISYKCSCPLCRTRIK